MGVLGRALARLGWERKAAAPVTWANGEPMGSARGEGSVGAAGEAVSAQSVLALSAVWGCSNLISGTISSLPAELRRRAADGLTEVASDHPLHGVLYGSPNYEQTALDFWDYLCLSLELWGNAYARKVRGTGGRIVALYPVHPEAVSVTRNASGALRYRWTQDGVYYDLSDAEVFHIRGPGGDPLGGMSTLRFGREAFSSALAADRAAASMFRNGLRTSAVLTLKEWMTPDQRALTDTRLVEKYQGAMNSGRPFIAEGGMDFKALSISPEDAQMLETRQFGIEEICRFFGVPPVMIGHSGASTAWPTSVEQQMIAFQTYTLRRRIKRIEQAVDKQLLSAEDRAAGLSLRFNLDALLRGDSASRAAFYGAMTGIGAMTINEVRAREGLPAVAGGDVPRMQMQNVPITGPITGAGDGTV
jgi:HK97 family phage portal protein